MPQFSLCLAQIYMVVYMVEIPHSNDSRVPSIGFKSPKSYRRSNTLDVSGWAATRCPPSQDFSWHLASQHHLHGTENAAALITGQTE